MNHGYRGQVGYGNNNKFTGIVMSELRTHPDGISPGTLARSLHVRSSYIVNAIINRTDVAEDDNGKLVLVKW